jgi:hypothetical protein
MISLMTLTLTLQLREAPLANQSSILPQHVTFETSETPQIGRLLN